MQIANSPWLARVQQFIQSPLSADSSPSHAAQSKPAAAKQLMPELLQPQVTSPCFLCSAFQVTPLCASDMPCRFTYQMYGRSPLQASQQLQ